MNDDLHTYIEPELEARITALVLGEASEFEVDELERMIEEKPELAVFRRRIQSIHDLLEPAVKSEPDEAWQLSAARRATLRHTFSRKAGSAPELRPQRAAGGPWKAAIAIAACLVVCVVIFSMMTPMYKKGVEEDSSFAFVSYYADGDMDEKSARATSLNGGTTASDGSRMVQLKTNLPKEVVEGTPGSIKLPSITPGPRKKANKALAANKLSVPLVGDLPFTGSLYKSEVARSVKRRPSIPSSSISKAIASNRSSSVSVPVPDVNAPAPPADFGNGNDFSFGLAGGGAGGGQDADPFGGGGGGRQVAKNERASGKSGTPHDVLTSEQDDKSGAKAQNERFERIAGKVSPVVPSESGLVANHGFHRAVRDGKWFDEKEREFGTVAGETAEATDGGADETAAYFRKSDTSKRGKLGDKILPGNAGYAYNQKKEGDAYEGKLKLGADLKKDVSNITGSGPDSGGFADNGNSIDGILNSPGRVVSDGELVDGRQVAAGSGGASKDKNGRQNKNGIVSSGDSNSLGYGLGTGAGISLDFDDDLESNVEIGGVRKFRYPTEYEPPERPNVAKGGIKRDLSHIENQEEVRYSLDPTDAPAKPSDQGDSRKSTSIAEKEIARRTEAAAAEPGQKVLGADRMRKGIYMGEGLYNLGKYDEAEAEMKKVLQTDPDNKAARRMLEKVAATKSDYKAAYDNTRADLLNGVDKFWELGVSGEKRGGKPVTQQTPKPISSARPVDGLDLRGMNKQNGKSAEMVSGPQTKKSRVTAGRKKSLDAALKDSKPTGTTLARRDRSGRATMEKGKKKRPAVSIPSPVTPKALPDETITTVKPFSTFSLNVADVSFKLAKVALLEKGQWPDAAKVRTEEFVNTFNYGDPSPQRGEPVACAVEQSAHPFLQQRNLLRVGMKTASIGRSAPLRLTILLDNSGSMEREDREASVLAAIQVLASQLGPQDVITVVGFARQPRLLADRISGDKAHKLVEIVANTPSEGGTNIEEALRLARTLAKRQHTEGAQDRVVLITDGVANLGNTVPEELSKQIVAMRQEGIAFDACGVGAEGLNDDILEALTRKGDGRYYFLNRAEDADSGFAKQLAGALSPAAKNVKVQVKFNAKRVSKYRLLGFEKHRLKKEDFRNDKVDAAEMAAEEAGNAVYQIQVNPDGEGEVGQVFVRFLDTSTGRMVERSWPLPYEPKAKAFDLATPSMQLAGTAAMLGEKLHGTDAGSVRFSMISNTLGKLRGHYVADRKVQDLIRMCEKVK